MIVGAGAGSFDIENIVPAGVQDADKTFHDFEVARSDVIEPTSATTPLPATLPLFATGLGALGLIGWRRKEKATALGA